MKSLREGREGERVKVSKEFAGSVLFPFFSLPFPFHFSVS